MQNNKKYFGRENLIKNISSHRNALVNYFYKTHKGYYNILIMNGSCDELNRNKHCGAAFCVKNNNDTSDVTYYYITSSVTEINDNSYLTLNANLIPLVKKTSDNLKFIALNDKGMFIIDKKTVIDAVKPTNIRISKCDLEYHYYNNNEPLKKTNFDPKYITEVRYVENKNNQHAAKEITISARGYYRWKQTFSSIIKAYSKLTGVKLENGKLIGKPVANAAYKKSYPQFRRDIKENKLCLIAENGTSFPVTVITKQPEHPVKDDHNHIIERFRKPYNMDMVKVDQGSCNTKNKAEPVDAKTKYVDKNIDTLAQKMKEYSVSEQDIKKAVLSFGSNRYMLQAYVDGLKDKGCFKEAVYAVKVFDALNTINFD
jgi:hypothetical protein